jgi:uncharacterized protein (TIGR03437 family)
MKPTSTTMGCSVRHAVVLSFLLLAPALVAQPAPRRPRGIYALVNITEQTNIQTHANPGITPAQLEASFVGLYQDLLGNPAISGLAIFVNWDTLNPNPPSAANPYDWSYVDDAFIQVSAWNIQNPAEAPKTIQLDVLPGFQSPQWMLNQIPSCDGLFQSPVQTPPSTCGKATFMGFAENADGDVLPLPWNPFYKSSWQTFLTALIARYGSNPTFVSIAVAGPTASSDEMIVPDNSNSNNPQTQFGLPIAPNDMWKKLFAFHYPGMAAYQSSDQAFIDEWDNAIDMYGEIFSGVTLVGSMTADGLPNFSASFTIPSAFTGYCPSPDMACAAATTILSHFVDPSVGGANAKATQTDGMEASRVDLNLSIGGVKLLSQSTAQLAAPSAQILGGSEFNKSFANFPLDEGCTSTFPPDASDMPVGCSIPSTCTTDGCVPVACIPQACLAPGFTPANLTSYKTFGNVPSMDLIPPEQSEYNVLNQYFDGTAVASSFGGSQGIAPLNYLQIYAADVQYATANVNKQAQVVQAGGAMVMTTAQDLLNLASQKLLMIAEPVLVPSIATGGIVPGAIQPGEWLSIYGTNLASSTATWTGNFPTSLGGSSVTINGKMAYLSYVSPTQINLQAPNDTTTGAVPVVVTAPNGSATSTVTLAQFSPLFFLLDTKHVAGIILRANGSGAYGGGSYDIIGPTGSSLGYPTVAAKAGDSIALFGTGFGPTNPPVMAGQAFSGAAETTSQVTLGINNRSVAPAFVGLSGAGLYQLNLTVPAGLGTGDVALQASVGGIQTPSGVVISVQ